MKRIGLVFALVLITVIFTSIKSIKSEENQLSSLLSHKTLTATFAGGCFWYIEADFEKTHGVIEVISGYSGGKEISPTYKEVTTGKTGHRKTIQIIYDPTKTSYKELLNAFWRHIDPTDAGGQFVDRGKQYSSAIFYHNEEQRLMAEESKRELARTGPFKTDIVTDVLPFEAFYQAEKKHQNYHKKNPIRYNFYRYKSGRDDFLENSWKKHDQMTERTPVWYA